MSIGTSQYPTAVDDDSSLGVPADSFSTKPLSTTLAVNCLSTDVTIQLSASPSSIGAPSAYGIVSIDDEEITYTGVSGNNLTGCIRGIGGTTAIGHTAGVTVKFRYVAAFDKALRAALVAIQGTLGITGAFNFLQSMAAGVNAQTGTSYTVLDSDRGKLVTGTNASAQAYTLPQAGASSQFVAGWFAYFENRGAGTLTITPTTSTVDGGASLALTQNQGAVLFSDGTNYYAFRGGGSGASAGNLFVYTSQPTVSSTATETTLYTSSIPAGQLAHDGDQLVVQYAVQGVNNRTGGTSVIFTFRIYFDVTEFHGYPWSPDPYGNQDNLAFYVADQAILDHQITFTITRLSSTSYQVRGSILTSDIEPSVTSTTYHVANTRVDISGLAGGFFGSARTLKITGQANVANAGVLMYGRCGNVRYIPAP